MSTLEAPFATTVVLTILVVLAATGACGGDSYSSCPGNASCPEEDIGCTLIALHGLRLTILDKQTRQPICDAAVTITQPDSEKLVERIESARAYGTDPCFYYGLTERSGEFRLSIERQGYRALSRALRVERSDTKCHTIIRQDLTSELEALPDDPPIQDAGSDAPSDAGDGGDD